MCTYIAYHFTDSELYFLLCVLLNVFQECRKRYPLVTCTYCRLDFHPVRWATATLHTLSLLSPSFITLPSSPFTHHSSTPPSSPSHLHPSHITFPPSSPSHLHPSHITALPPSSPSHLHPSHITALPPSPSPFTSLPSSQAFHFPPHFTLLLISLQYRPALVLYSVYESWNFAHIHSLSPATSHYTVITINKVVCPSLPIMYMYMYIYSIILTYYTYILYTYEIVHFVLVLIHVYMPLLMCTKMVWYAHCLSQ